MAMTIVFASGVGIALSRSFPWSDRAVTAGFPTAFGIGLSPLLLGILTVVALGFLPGATHELHMGVVLVGLALVAAVTLTFRQTPRSAARVLQADANDWRIWVVTGMLLLWSTALLITAFVRPMTQNDALEYLTVGRLLYETRDLAEYPALASSSGTSGFYGPWTHPPLYPALIYLMYAIQGHANSPGLARLIAPWTALGAVCVIYAMGCLANRVTGLLAALLFISVPLFFLGAGSALIDAFPILGMAIVLCAVVGGKASGLRDGSWLGVALAFALWTHSQAVLLLPLTAAAVIVQTGWGKRRQAVQVVAVSLAVGIALGGWPYLRNLQRFGSLISDNPVVFRIPALGWNEYFTMQRGYEHWPELLQYGLLKAWFAFEAYGLMFWLMAVGIAIYLWQLHRDAAWRALACGDDTNQLQRWQLTALAVIACYLAGAVLSVFLGIDLMVRNERYLLMLTPCAALLAAFGIDHVTDLRKHRAAIDASLGSARTIAAAVVLVFTVQLGVVGVYAWKSVDTSSTSAGITDDSRLRHLPAYRAVEFLRSSTPSDALVLSLKPADMYYSGRRMLSYLDPRLLDFYDIRDPAIAWRSLRALGVSFIHIPDYSLPSLYNSVLDALIARTDLAALVFSDGGHQIYDITTAGKPFRNRTIAVAPPMIPWTQIQQITLGGRKNLLRLTRSERIVDDDSFVSEEGRFPLFRREQTTLMVSGRGAINAGRGRESFVPVVASSEYRLDLQLEGHGFVHVSLLQYDAGGRLIDVSLIGETALNNRSKPRSFRRRFVTRGDAALVRFSVEHRGKSSLRIAAASMLQ